MLGFKIHVNHLDDHTFTLERRAGTITSHGETERVVGEGMPKYGSPSDFGDMIVTYKIKSPETLNPGQKETIK